MKFFAGWLIVNVVGIWLSIPAFCAIESIFRCLIVAANVEELGISVGVVIEKKELSFNRQKIRQGLSYYNAYFISEKIAR